MATDDRINEDFFKFVDTPLKAYILGLVAFNSNNAIAADTSNVLIKLNNVKEHDNNNKSISYGYYKDLKSEDRKNYPYFNNIDVLIEHLKELGNVKYSENGCINGIIDLTINSQKMKDDIARHLDIKDNIDKDLKDCDISEIITKWYKEDVNICNQFVKAYIEKYASITSNASIICDSINITFYNEKSADSLIKLYEIPYNRMQGINNVVIQYNSVNMIDLLGMLYSNCDCPYYNNYIYTYNNRDGNSIPSIKVFTADESAVIPSKARYSDAGYDLTIIKEYKRLTSNTIIYDTGIKLEIPNGYYVEIVPRSSISKSGYILANNVGIIDQGYRGNLYIALAKINDEMPDLTLPYKCCQMIVKKQVYSKLVYSGSGSSSGSDSNDSSSGSIIGNSSRGTGAFGSTGV
uniref:dUTP diphosphatase n=1 Tax=viral metagenome TaxID=1070528 RepID=A0A6C0IBT9_9ZZZZ